MANRKHMNISDRVNFRALGKATKKLHSHINNNKNYSILVRGRHHTPIVSTSNPKVRTTNNRSPQSSCTSPAPSCTKPLITSRRHTPPKNSPSHETLPQVTYTATPKSAANTYQALCASAQVKQRGRYLKAKNAREVIES